MFNGHCLGSKGFLCIFHARLWALNLTEVQSVLFVVVKMLDILSALPVALDALYVSGLLVQLDTTPIILIIFQK